MNDDFRLDPTLEDDTLQVADLALCRVRLMNDSRFPWLVLVPRRAGCRELIDLDPDDRRELTAEIDRCTRVLRDHAGADKMNVAALGNQVAQLHVHVIARFVNDSAWPRPVWGVGSPRPYPNEAATQCAALARALDE
ncbi:HIT domain-containing protein [Halomonas denitrificans]|nr:HIT domain-containing protein [Halomonas denitrificans]